MKNFLQCDFVSLRSVAPFLLVITSNRFFLEALTDRTLIILSIAAAVSIALEMTTEDRAYAILSVHPNMILVPDC
jgi:hypothetical protein